MAEEVTKVVENVDKLFSEIVVNGERHVSDRYVSPEPAQANSPSRTEETQGEDIFGAELNGVLHNFVDRAVAQGLADEVTARQSADNLLRGFIDAINLLIPSTATEQNKLADSNSVNAVQTNVNNIESLIPSTATEQNKLADSNSVNAVQTNVDNIESLIPNQASVQNKLADKDFVNSSIATNTANFLGTYTTLAEIQAIQNPTNNDYAFLETADGAGNNVYDRYKYSAEDEQWLFEYELNNSSFTAEQWATINSGLTQSSVDSEIDSAVSEAISEINISQLEGVLPASKGGTGQTTAKDACNAFINALDTGSSTPTDNDYYVSQYVNGGTTTTTYHRRPMSALWEYIKGKISSVLGLTDSAYSGKADTAGTADEAKKLSVAGNFSTSAVTYIKVSGILTTNSENVFTLQSREGELLLISAGYGDILTIKAPRILRLCNAYTKVDGCRLSGSDLIFKVNAWSHVCIITQIAGNSSATITTATTTETEYNNGTEVIIEDINYGTAYCTTAGGTQAKVASMRGYVLQSGATFPITFTNANTYNGVITLNVNSTGAKNIYINNAVTSSSNKTLPAGTYLCRYNGSYYYIDTSYFVTNARNANYAATATDAYYVGSGRGAATGYYMSPSYDSTNNWIKMNGYYGTGTFNSRNSCADIALKIRTSAPSSPADGDIWIE